MAWYGVRKPKMKLQYVFGNPTKPKKRSKKVAKKKRKNPRQTTVKVYQKIRKKNKKTGKMSNRRGPLQAAHKTPKISTRAELKKMKSELDLLQATSYQLQHDKKMVKGKAAKSKMTKLIAKAKAKAKKFNDKYITEAKLTAAEKKEMATLLRDLRQAGQFIVQKQDVYTGSIMATKKKGKNKKTVGKKKPKSKAKKTVSKKKPKSKAKKAGGTKKTTTKKSSRRRKRNVKVSKSKAIKKGYVLKANPKKKRRSRRKSNPYFGGVIMKNNPMSVAGMKVAGYDPMELAELATGGLFYGAANSYLSPLFAKIPGLGGMAGMLGGTVPSLMAGIALNIISGKVNNRQVKLHLLGVLRHARLLLRWWRARLHIRQQPMKLLNAQRLAFEQTVLAGPLHMLAHRLSGVAKRSADLGVVVADSL